MKYTFPIITLCKGGAQRMLAEITNGLVERGHDVTILMPKDGVVEYDVSAKIIRTRTHTILASDYPASDVIVSNYYTLIPDAQEASEQGKGIHIRLSLCYEPTFLPDNHTSFRTYHMPHILVLSKWQQQLIYLNHGVKGHIVPVGISSTFRNLNLRQPDGPVQISAIVRNYGEVFSWHREQDYLIDQLKLIKQYYPHVGINLICPPNELSISTKLKQLQQTGLFRFLTPSNDEELNYFYNLTDILVNSSTIDTASLPGLEAMKCGAALVTTYGGGNADYCRDGENCLISYFYENRLYENIARLINDPILRNRLAKSGEFEATKWTWEESLDRFEFSVKKILLSAKR